MAGLVLPLLMGVPGVIGGIMSMIESGKRLSGGRIKRRPRRKYGGRVKRVHKRRGRGIAADIASSLPLIGGLAGPLVRALGGRIKRKIVRRKKGRGYYGMNIQPSLLNRLSKRILHSGNGLPNTHIYQPITGFGLLGPGMYRPARYGGLLSPTGGKVNYRRPYKKIVFFKRAPINTKINRKKLLMY